MARRLLPLMLPRDLGWSCERRLFGGRWVLGGRGFAELEGVLDAGAAGGFDLDFLKAVDGDDRAVTSRVLRDGVAPGCRVDQAAISAFGISDERATLFQLGELGLLGSAFG